MHIEAHPMESLGAELDYTLDDFHFREEHVWCNWCQCEVRPQLFAMRQHRRVCTTDPRVAAPPVRGDRIG